MLHLDERDSSLRVGFEPQRGNAAMRTTSRINIVASCLIFTFSFLTYLSAGDSEGGLDARIQLIPIVLLTCFVLVQVMFSKRWPKHASLFIGEGSLVLWLVPIFTLVASLQSNYEKSPQYWIVNAGVLLLARLFVARVALREILLGYFWAGVSCIILLLMLAWQSLLGAVQTLSKFTDYYGFHPNTLAFALGSFGVASIWQFVVASGLKKILAAVTLLFCLAITFLAASRGSLVAITMGATVIGAMYCFRKGRIRSFAVVLAGLVFCFWLIVRSDAFGSAFDYTETYLQLTNSGRGIDSGMSGRLDEWRTISLYLGRGSWLYGNGVRAADALLYPVDNGFLVLLYDMGILPVLLITGRFAVIVYRLARNYLSLGRDLELVSLFLVLVFLLNNIVARYLFGVGNPFSLLMLMFLVGTWTTHPYRQTTYLSFKPATTSGIGTASA